MIVLILMLLASLATIAAALTVPQLHDLIWLGGAGLLASVMLLLVAWRERPVATQTHRWVIIDGSNVLHWKDNTPKIETVREVIARLMQLGFTPGIVFDANAGYKFDDRYRDDRAIARLLNLPEDRVLVVAKGMQADPILLAAARDVSARVVSNDRYRDWAEDHPEVAQPGFLIRGGYRDGTLWLEVEEEDGQ